MEAAGSPGQVADAGKALPGTTSRLVENRTTHAADFQAAEIDKVYLPRIASVAGRAVPASAAGALAYVPGIVGGTVAIVDTSSYAMVSSITSGLTNPYGAAAIPGGDEVWVTESGTNTVSVISTQTNKTIDTIVVGVYPQGITATPDGKTVYVANTGPNTGRGGSHGVSMIDVASRKVRRTIRVGEAPQIVAISHDDAFVFVTCADGIYRITRSGHHAHKAPEHLRHPHGVALTPNGSHAYATDTEGSRVVVLDAANLHTVARIPVGRNPWNVAFRHGGAEAFVTNANDNTVSVIDASTKAVKKTIRLGAGTTSDKEASFNQRNQIPTAIASGPDGKIWAACNASSSLVVIDPASRRVVHSIDLGIGDMPTGIAFA